MVGQPVVREAVAFDGDGCPGAFEKGLCAGGFLNQTVHEWKGEIGERRRETPPKRNILGERSDAAGAPQKAFEDANTLLAMAEVSSSPHLLIGELVRISILSMALEVLDDGLCRSAWSDSNLAAFSNSLAQKNLIVQMADALRMERAVAQQWDWNDLKLLALLPKVTGEKATWTELITGIVWRIRPAGWVNRDRALHLLLMQRMIEALGDGGSISPAEFRGQFRQRSGLQQVSPAGRRLRQLLGDARPWRTGPRQGGNSDVFCGRCQGQAGVG